MPTSIKEFIKNYKQNLFSIAVGMSGIISVLLLATFVLHKQEKENSYHSWDSFVSYYDINTYGKWEKLLIVDMRYLPTSFYPISEPNSIALIRYGNYHIDAFKTITKIRNLLIFEGSIENLNGLMNLKEVSDSLLLTKNKINNIDGLNHLEKVGEHLRLSHNSIRDISSLNNLVLVGGSLSLNNNVLENLDGLDNLQYIGGDLDLYKNPLRNINGISNIVIGGGVYIDADYDGDKLKSDTIFCLRTEPNQFLNGFAQKEQVCEIDN